MFVMHFMGLTDPTGVPIVDVAEYFESLVDKYIVNDKISNTIGQIPKADGPSIPKSGIIADDDAGHAHHCVENEEGIVTFEPRVMVLSMVISMQTP